MTTTIGGFKDRKIESRSKVEPSTAQYIGEYRQGIDSVAQVAYVVVATDSVESNSTTSVIVATSHQAKIGDIIQFLSGTLIHTIAFVQSTTTSQITLSQTLSSTPAVASTFVILRPSIVRVNSSGEVLTAITGTVTVDSSTLALEGGGNLEFLAGRDFATETTLATLNGKVTACNTNAIKGADTISSAPSANPVTIGMKEFFTGTVQHPHCITSGGVNYQLMLLPDLALNFLAYTTTGEMRTHSFSTNGLASGSKYALVDSSGRLVIKNGQSASASTTSVAGSATSVTLLASNASRVGATIFNDSSATLYIKLGATASTTSFVTKLYTDQYYEVPFGYTGVIDGIWSSATGSARMVELT